MTPTLNFGRNTHVSFAGLTNFQVYAFIPSAGESLQCGRNALMGGERHLIWIPSHTMALLRLRTLRATIVLGFNLFDKESQPKGTRHRLEKHGFERSMITIPISSCLCSRDPSVVGSAFVV